MLNESNIPLEEDGIEEEILVDEEVAITKAMWGDVGGNIENQTDLQNALDAKQDSLTEAQLNAVNSGIISEKVTTYDGYADQIASKADQSALNAESTARGEADTALGTRIDNEVLARQQADNGLQSQIDAITSKSDVVDVVANYAALQAYDTSTLGNNDVVKVLDDETHEDALTYYRWSTTTQTWSYIGQEAPYYSKGQMDVKLAEKQDKLTAGANIQIQNGTISATDTKYTAGNGLNLNGTEFSANTDVLATKEDLEGYYTKPETDNLLAPKLEAEVVTELPTTGAEGKLYLTPKAHTTQTAIGNPIEATVTAQAGQLESFQLDGDTFQQSYTGKNLLKLTQQSRTSNGITASLSNGVISYSGTATTNWANLTAGTTNSIPAGEYTFSMKEDFASNYVLSLNVTYTDKTTGFEILRYTGKKKVITFSKDVASYFISIASLVSGTTYSGTMSLMLESGTTDATPFEPYVGGQPSPNPSYPQQIQTVTGTQTISINGTDYPINLGSIELCKLGDYHDYIWKDGESWKVHKATATITLTGASSENWYIDQYAYMLNNVISAKAFSDIANMEAYCRSFSKSATGQTSSYAVSFWYNAPGTSVRFIKDQTPDLSSFRNWLASNNQTVYYPLATATDTTITDTTLIAQLEAIRTASLENGTNTITNTATGSNLAGDIEIGYFGFNPNNRYDKWLWLDLNNNYEQIGGE